jgi:hypothetical protein
MKQCGEQWQVAKAARTTNGATWPQFLTQCRAQLGSGSATAAPTQAPVQPQTGSLFPWQQPTSPAPAPTASAATGSQSVMKQCGAQWQSAKAAGATWPQFLKACRAQLASTTSTSPQGGFAPAPPASAPAPSPAPTQSGSLFPRQQPAAPAPAATGTGRFASPQEAQYRCPGATVVWVNEHSHIYHFPDTRDYGHTSGAYMCEAEAQASGNRAAKNERHP